MNKIFWKTTNIVFCEEKQRVPFLAMIQKADTGMLIILANLSHFSSRFLDVRLF
jgi:hypothetical protein